MTGNKSRRSASKKLSHLIPNIDATSSSNGSVVKKSASKAKKSRHVQQLTGSGSSSPVKHVKGEYDVVIDTSKTNIDKKYRIPKLPSIGNTVPTSSHSSSSSKSEQSDNSLVSNAWPESLSHFVSTSFLRASHLDEVTKTQFNKQMQQLIEMAIAKNMLWSNDWMIQKIPILDGGVDLSLVSQESEPETGNGFAPSRSNSPAIHDYQALNTKRSADYESKERKKQRSERFQTVSSSPRPVKVSTSSSPVFVGISQALEKNYLRLTSEPKPEMVRPQDVLERSMDYVLAVYEANKIYSYIINQFKSIRQDLTVQHIKNDFTIYVYETNARISLQNRDLGEFNQCQSQLNYLYYMMRKSSTGSTNRFFASEVEFLAYRILYMMITNNHSEVFKLKLTLINNFSQFTRTAEEEDLFDFIGLLFRLHQDIITEDFHDFFFSIKNLKSSAKLSLALATIRTYLFEKNRLRSLYLMTSSYKKLNTSFVKDELCFDDVDALITFLQRNKLTSIVSGTAQEVNCVVAKPMLVQIVNQPNFSKVDIKGQL
ncbi:hypothetical protein G9P44_000478 [Scheffersomyces stipitis]|nr:hypothetical protein G9P44_000478 [Scheffersomyces stipitis]